MTEQEQSRFIEQELRGFWPEWNPTDAELRVWSQALACTPYGLARKAVQALFREQRANYRRPVFSRFVKEVRQLGGTTSPPCQRRDPTTNVYVECVEAPPHKPNVRGFRKGVYTEKQDDPDHVQAAAKLMRDRHEEIYGGRWITVQIPPAGGCRPPERQPERTGTTNAGATQRRTERRGGPSPNDRDDEPVPIGAVAAAFVNGPGPAYPPDARAAGRNPTDTLREKNFDKK